MFIGRHASSLLLIAASLAAASPAQAQTPPVVTYADSHPLAEIVGSVFIQGPPEINQRPLCQRFSVPCTSIQPEPDAGLALTTTVFPTDRIGVVGELGIHVYSWWSNGTGCGYPGCLASEHEHLRSLVGGLRLRTRLLKMRSIDEGMRFFVQVLAGPEWSNRAPLHHVVQPGIGLEGPWWDNTAVLHIEYDYRFAPRPGRSLSAHRFLIGVGVPIGRL